LELLNTDPFLGENSASKRNNNNWHLFNTPFGPTRAGLSTSDVQFSMSVAAITIIERFFLCSCVPDSCSVRTQVEAGGGLFDIVVIAQFGVWKIYKALQSQFIMSRLLTLASAGCNSTPPPPVLGCVWCRR
jgi:hypothetical protein